MGRSKIRYLAAKEVDRCLGMKETIYATRDAFRRLSSGEAEVPLRSGIIMERGKALFMPAFLPSQRRIGVKTVTLYKDNPESGLPMTDALITLFDSETGQPLALMDGERLTAIRTGAASGVATDLLARRDSSTAFIIGAGPQAETQLEAVAVVRELEQAYVYDIKKELAERFAKAMQTRLRLRVKAADSVKMISEADIICTVTPAEKPVFADADLREGTHINAVGAFTPDMCEIPPDTVKRAYLAADLKEACLTEPGDIVQPLEAGIIAPDHIKAEIGKIIAGKAPDRKSVV